LLLNAHARFHDSEGRVLGGEFTVVKVVVVVVAMAVMIIMMMLIMLIMIMLMMLMHATAAPP